MDFCCTPLFDGIVDSTEATDLAAVFAALGDPVRIRIVSMLASAPEGSACGCDLEGPLGLSQPTVSHHLRILREAGLIEGNREGRWVHYRLIRERVDELRSILDVPAIAVG